jgi:hypothetical protein
MQHSHPHKPNVNRPVAVEVDGEPLGVLVPDVEGFRFLAVRFNAFAIDGKVFETIEAAQDAASEAVHAAE